jgi:hypothetical protein
LAFEAAEYTARFFLSQGDRISARLWALIAGRAAIIAHTSLLGV